MKMDLYQEHTRGDEMRNDDIYLHSHKMTLVEKLDYIIDELEDIKNLLKGCEKRMSE